ncbi:MAG: lamin tail domain-containing protein [Polyangiaceae bacterium]
MRLSIRRGFVAALVLTTLGTFAGLACGPLATNSQCSRSPIANRYGYYTVDNSSNRVPFDGEINVQSGTRFRVELSGGSYTPSVNCQQPARATLERIDDVTFVVTMQGPFPAICGVNVDVPAHLCRENPDPILFRVSGPGAPFDAGPPPADASQDAPLDVGAPTDAAPDTLVADGSSDAPMEGSAPDAGGCNPDMVISEVYPHGGILYGYDYVTLHNRSRVTINLSGWSLQGQDGFSTGDWDVTPLSGTVPPGGYYLVRLAQTVGGNVQSLPAHQASGTYNLPAGGGRVAIVAGLAPLTGAFPAGYVDLFGYGSTQQFEGAAFSGLASGYSAARNDLGCTDTNTNSTDFVLFNPTPRSAASPVMICSACP